MGSFFHLVVVNSNMTATTQTGKGHGAVSRNHYLDRRIETIYIIQSESESQSESQSSSDLKIVKQNFTQSDLSSNTYTFDVGFDPCIVQVWNNDNQVIIPDEIEKDGNQVTIDLESFTPISNEWRVNVVGS